MLDTHCHLDRYTNAQDVAARAAGRGVFTVAVTNLPSHFEAGLPYARLFPGLRLALGLHPLAAIYHQREMASFERCFEKTSFIGEVGLDFSTAGRSAANVQLASFDRVAALLQGSHKFVSVHSRRAETEVLDVLARHKVSGVVFHWYTGTLPVLERVLEEGHFLSINPAMTQSAKGREIIERTPPDRLLTETDGPFVQVNRTPAHPWHVELVEKHVARLWGKSAAEVRTQVWENFQRMLKAAE